MITKIISGGQTGADIGGLLGAEDIGIPTGGMAPKGYRTEIGAQEFYLRFRFKLEESVSKDYFVRTEMNVVKSHGTIVFMFVNSSGSRLTMKYCDKHKRPYFLIPNMNNLPAMSIMFVDWLKRNGIGVLNVAGNRESVCNGIEKIVRIFIGKTVKYYNSKS